MYNDKIKVLFNIIILTLLISIIILFFIDICFYNQMEGNTTLTGSCVFFTGYPLFVNVVILLLLIVIFLLYRLMRRSEKMARENGEHVEDALQEETIQTMLKVLEKHDPYTKGHSKTVAVLSSEFAAFIGISERKVKDIYLAALVHDIGKILVPNSILNKPQKLTSSEFELIKKHPEIAYEILMENQTLKDVAIYVKYHHERYDGRGYPENLSGEEIPLESRLISLADSWDAMITDRIYKKGISEDEAALVLKENSGTQFDPILVDKWIEFIKLKKNDI